MYYFKNHLPLLDLCKCLFGGHFFFISKKAFFKYVFRSALAVTLVQIGGRKVKANSPLHNLNTSE